MTERINLIGKRFGRLVVQESLGVNEKGQELLRCLCDCGNEKITNRKTILRGHCKSCGCLSKEGRPSKNKIPMIGRRFGRLVVVEEAEETGGRGQPKYLCQCDCGNMIVVLGESLRRKKTLSCGCYFKERASEANRTHGGSKERLYHVWQGMKDRCANPNSGEYKNYGGRGISVCKEWLDYENFREFMLSNGYNPRAKMGECTIERIDVNGNYCPENCTIIPSAKQYFNRTDNHRITYNGETKLLSEWARDRGWSESTILRRLKLGWSIEEALGTPLRKPKTHIADGEEHTTQEWADLIGIPLTTLKSRLKVRSMQEMINYYYPNRNYLNKNS